MSPAQPAEQMRSRNHQLKSVRLAGCKQHRYRHVTGQVSVVHRSWRVLSRLSATIKSVPNGQAHACQRKSTTGQAATCTITVIGAATIAIQLDRNEVRAKVARRPC